MNALEAAARAAKRFGVAVGTPVPLRSTNNQVVWLAPAPVVAKVGPPGRLASERRIAVALSAMDAPVVDPAPGLPIDVHHEGGHAMTFWTHIPGTEPHDPVDPAALGAQLAELHEHLACLPVDLRDGLPSFISEIETALLIVEDPNAAPLLSSVDRQMLERAGHRASTSVADVRERFVLHGSPHSYNVLVVSPARLVFVDFEAVCTGPIEWDLAHQSDAVALGYPKSIDDGVLDACRFAASFKTAAFCWADADRGDLRDHAEFHTARVRHQLQQNPR